MTFTLSFSPANPERKSICGGGSKEDLSLSIEYWISIECRISIATERKRRRRKKREKNNL